MVRAWLTAAVTGSVRRRQRYADADIAMNAWEPINNEPDGKRVKMKVPAMAKVVVRGVPRMGFEPMTFGFPWKRSADQNPMSPTLHQAEPPRHKLV